MRPSTIESNDNSIIPGTQHTDVAHSNIDESFLAITANSNNDQQRKDDDSQAVKDTVWVVAGNERRNAGCLEGCSRRYDDLRRPLYILQSATRYSHHSSFNRVSRLLQIGGAVTKVRPIQLPVRVHRVERVPIQPSQY
jgi:hypothetical protein